MLSDTSRLFQPPHQLLPEYAPLDTVASIQAAARHGLL